MIGENLEFKHFLKFITEIDSVRQPVRLLISKILVFIFFHTNFQIIF